VAHGIDNEEEVNNTTVVVVITTEDMLFGASQLRKRLFAYYFANTDSSHYVRELARVLHVDPTNLSRELRALEAEGMMVMEQRGTLRYYTLNKRHPIFRELKRVVAKTIGVEAQLQTVLSKVPSIATAILYGSFAKGDEDAASDIDVLVVGTVTMRALLEHINPLEKKLGRDINVVAYSPEEYRRRKRQRDPLLMSIFSSSYRVLIGSI